MSTEQATGSKLPDSMVPDSAMQNPSVQNPLVPNPTSPSEAEQHVVEPVRTGNSDLCKIVIHNDEVTPYDFVISILGDLFMLSEEMADHIAWTAHTKGEAVVVVRPRAEAEKLVKVAHGRARQVSYPLTFSIEQD
jgi:ATP-dependent Clp protease adaptor protein ClpS